MGKLQLDRW